MGIPRGSRASRSIVSWDVEPTRFRTTPATLTFGSNVEYPWTIAATERDIALASTTRTMGAWSSLATWAVEARSPPPSAVEEAHDAFDHGYVGTLRAVGEERADKVRAGEEGVEVASRPACGEGVVRGVYKVGADLEGGDPKATRGERGHKSRGN